MRLRETPQHRNSAVQAMFVKSTVFSLTILGLALSILLWFPQVDLQTGEMLRQSLTTFPLNSAPALRFRCLYNSLHQSLLPLKSQLVVNRNSPLNLSSLPFHQNSRLTSLFRSFSTTQPNMSGSKAFIDTLKARRTIYALSHESPVPDSKIQELVTDAIKHVPSSFNSQSTRLVVVLGDEHTKLWDMISDVYKAMLPADKFEHFNGRVMGFRGGYGTVSLFSLNRPFTWTLVDHDTSAA